MKVFGLDTVKASLHLCPLDLTIYGNVTVRRAYTVGSYVTNLDYINHGSQVFAHGDGDFNITIARVKITNIIAPLRYSRATKKLELDDMQYELSEQMEAPKVTGLQTDGEGGHMLDMDEFAKIDQLSSYPTVIEFLRAVSNTKTQNKGLHLEILRRFFGSVLSS